MPYSTTDLDHLLNLLELLPWEPDEHGDAEGCEAPTALMEAFDNERWSYLNNSTLDYAPVRNGARESSLIYRLCMYMVDVFEALPDDQCSVVGQLVAGELGVDAPHWAIGARWAEDVTATAWRILVPYIAESRRSVRQNTPADMTPHRGDWK